MFYVKVTIDENKKKRDETQTSKNLIRWWDEKATLIFNPQRAFLWACEMCFEKVRHLTKPLRWSSEPRERRKRFKLNLNVRFLCACCWCIFDEFRLRVNQAKGAKPISQKWYCHLSEAICGNALAARSALSATLRQHDDAAHHRRIIWSQLRLQCVNVNRLRAMFLYLSHVETAQSTAGNKHREDSFTLAEQFLLWHLENNWFY